MASTRDLAINIVGNSSSAVKAFDDVGDAASRQKGKFDGLKAGVTIASAAIVAGVTKFAGDSVAAYADAEQSQAALVAAYEKFPAIANVSIDALNELNTEIQRKTGMDGDALAASQATLAQFGLTGEQIQQLTPLMADYAAKTGKDLPTAAEALGKAVMGQGRALKEVGVDFTDTGSAAGNFEQLVAGLDGTVGGFAETMGGTAAGKAAILEQSFGDIQETIGQFLIPVLTTLADVGATVTAWLADNPSVLQAVAIAVGVLTVAIIAANIAMWAMAANPIVLLIMAIVVAVGIVIAAVWLLVANWDAVVAWITTVWTGFVSWITGVINGFVGWWNGIWSAVGQWISSVWSGIVTNVSNFFNMLYNRLRSVGSAVSGWWNGLWSGIGSFFGGIWAGILGTIQNVRNAFSIVFNAIAGIVRGAFNGVVGVVRGVINGIISAVNGVIGAINGVAGAVGGALGVNISIPRIPRLATGTITSGPMLALVGDNPGGREVIAPYDSYVSELQRAAAAGARSANAGGPVRLAREDLDYMADRVGQTIYPLIITGAQKTFTAALGG